MRVSLDKLHFEKTLIDSILLQGKTELIKINAKKKTKKGFEGTVEQHQLFKKKDGKVRKTINDFEKIMFPGERMDPRGGDRHKKKQAKPELSSSSSLPLSSSSSSSSSSSASSSSSVSSFVFPYKVIFKKGKSPTLSIPVSTVHDFLFLSILQHYKMEEKDFVMIVERFNKLQKSMVNVENRTDENIADNEEFFEDDVDDNIADIDEDLEDEDIDDMDDDIADIDEDMEDEDIEDMDDDISTNEEDKEDEEVRSNDDNYYFGDEDGDVQENVEQVYIEDIDKDNFQDSQNRKSIKVAALGEKRKLTLTEEPSRKSKRCRKVNSLFTDYVP
jgi:hypothetical protein